VVAAVGGQKLRALVTAYEQAAQGHRPTLQAGEKDALGPVKDKHLLSTLKMLFQSLLPSLSSVARQLPVGLRVELLQVDLSSMGGPCVGAQAELLRDIDAGLLDEALEAISDRFARGFALAQLADIESTAVRIRMVAAELARNVAWPALVKVLMRAVQRLWSRTMAEALVSELVSAAWTGHDAEQIAFRDLQDLGDRVDRAVALSVIGPALDGAMPDNSRKILRLWFDIGQQRPVR
jgi:hypothetical protein